MGRLPGLLIEGGPHQASSGGIYSTSSTSGSSPTVVEAFLCNNELCGCTGDVNFDGQVNGADMTIILASWGVCPDPLECIADINGDGIVDGADVTQVFGNWGACP